MGESSKLRGLREFLLDAMTECELRRMLFDVHGASVASALPTLGSLEAVFDEAAHVLARRGLVDAALFAWLAAFVPAKRGQLERLAAQWCVRAPWSGAWVMPVRAPQIADASAGEARPATARAAYAAYAYAIVETTPTSSIRRAVSMVEGSCQCGVSLIGLPEGEGSLEFFATGSSIVLSPQGTDAFVRMRGSHVLQSQDRFIIGNSVFEFAEVGGYAVLRYAADGRMETVSLLGSARLGREDCALRLPEDPTISRRHARIDLLATPDDAHSYVLVDVGSANGTWLRIRQRCGLVHGDEFRVDDVGFRVEITLRR